MTKGMLMPCQSDSETLTGSPMTAVAAAVSTPQPASTGTRPNSSESAARHAGPSSIDSGASWASRGVTRGSPKKGRKATIAATAMVRNAEANASSRINQPYTSASSAASNIDRKSVKPNNGGAPASDSAAM